MVVESETRLSLSNDWDKYRAEQAGAYLQRVRTINIRIISLRSTLDDLYAKAQGVNSLDYSRPMVASSVQTDKMTYSVARLMELTEDLYETIESYTNEIAAAERALALMSNQRHAAVLEMRYLAGRSWDDCARVFHVARSTMMEIHAKALVDFYEVMPRSQADSIPDALGA